MPKIYQENQVTPLSNSVGSPAAAQSAEALRGYARRMDEEAQQHERQAKQTYSTALKISASDTMNQLYAQYPDDPVTLQAEFKKAYDKSVGEIVDDDVKVDFMANAAMQSQSYINKAIYNKQQKDKKIAKATTYNSIYNNNNNAGLYFTNLMKNPTVDDLANYNINKHSTISAINSMDSDGNFLFTPEQQRRMAEDREKAIFNSLVASYRQMTPNEQIEHARLLSEDGVTMVVDIDKDNVAKTANIMDEMQYDTYEKYKDFVAKTVEKAEKKLSRKNNLLSPEDAIGEASEQTLNNISFANSFKEINKMDNKNEKMMALLAQRDAIVAQAMAGKLDEKDFDKRMEETVIPLIEASKEDYLDNRTWFGKNTSVQYGKRALSPLLDVVSNEEKAYLLSELYSGLSQAGIADGYESGNEGKINAIVDGVRKRYVEKKAPGVIGKEVSKVLLNGSLVNYQQPKNTTTIQPKNYRLIESDGVKYRQYKDRNGNYSKDSVFQRI